MKLETRNIKKNYRLLPERKNFQTAVELHVMIIFFCYRPGGKCLETQNCVNSAPIVISLVSSTNGKYGKIVFGVW